MSDEPSKLLNGCKNNRKAYHCYVYITRENYNNTDVQCI